MATLLLTVAATALTAGAPAWAATAAALAASTVGAFVDQRLFSGTVKREGPRLADLQVQTSAEGAPVPEMAGRLRLSGQVIWATRFREEATTETTGGGKGGGGGGSTSVTSYRYFANFAVALCEGAIDRLWRVWADGKPLDLSGIVMRVYPGDGIQDPDPLIEAIEGAGRAPAYRGTAYVVFENLPLERFGNRLPQLTFEVFRRVGPVSGPALETRIEGITLIPGGGEFAYDTHVVTSGSEATAAGLQLPQNRSAGDGRADLLPALDDLAASLPAVRRVSLVVGWFGDDLRAAQCRIQPRVEHGAKATFEGRTPIAWSVQGLARGEVPVVSLRPDGGHRAYGGTPSDASVVRAILELRARGYQVVLYPFLFMDIPAGNTLPNPYSAGGTAAGQPAHPWRGRITAGIAPGYGGSPDGTAAVAAEIAAFVGTAGPAHFGAAVDAGTGTVTSSYAGPAEWSLRRLVLHYARLAAAVNAAAPGAVSAFVIGSELRGLTTLRDGGGHYPFVAALRALAADCRAVMGAAVQLTYAADWSEYFGHQPGDGSGDLRYHLDPLWADAHIDAVGIDNYLPLADWRDGTDHLDAAAGWAGPHDGAYLRANIEGGEYYDWYYASAADRREQRRTPITDGAYGKPWVYRPKDLRRWWAEAHVERIGGIEQPAPTAWVPSGKPIWFTELGIPSIDRGCNQPNVFFDPKSAESALPHFSAGTRDDLVQRAGLAAWLDHFGPAAATNPVSPVYGGRMVTEIAVWTWDARPYPAWPARADLWGDTDLWPTGHWLNGKVALADLGGLVAAICGRAGLGPGEIDVSALRGIVPGYLRDRVLSPRGEIEALMEAFDFDAAEGDGRLRFRPKGGGPAAVLTLDDIAAGEEERGDLSITRAQETDLPGDVTIRFTDLARDYRTAAVVSRRQAGGAVGRHILSLPLALDEEQALRMAERLLTEAWIGRESVRFALPPSRLAFDPGDTLDLVTAAGRLTLRIGRISETGRRDVEARVVEPAAHGPVLSLAAPQAIGRLPVPAGLSLAFLDLPVIDETVPPHRPWVAAGSVPAVEVAVAASATGDSYETWAVLPVAATFGVTVHPLYNGPTAFWDEGNVLGVALVSGSLSSRPRDRLLAGDANALAIENADGDWEILQFAAAAPVGPGRYDLRGLLRGRLGTEQAMRSPVAAGARVVALTGALRSLPLPLSLRQVEMRYRFGPAAAAGHGDPSWEERRFTARGIGLRPYAPVHVRGRRDAAGNLEITWIRRTRIGGQWSDHADVPLSEEQERYDIEILDGAGPAVKRTLNATVPHATYGAASAVADFGWIPAAVVVRVYQVSALFGRGLAATATI
ncbi:baseplate multidomain protein megatron [Zavarzinia compransoris]|uniref:Host specificity protein n=1 Tax=Zavarzinia compransoris TaxID=1264899 RepID=A0A317DZ51_9PROT|nr:glycoside hydrolase/phage tail family protein [Zavarzinia compransoris]PWR19156.1 hypothetical protein DKG75_19580 [Zavarzinia compransoris]TDP49170.1 putative tail protein [Zavarzinia compransoris]